MQEPITSYIGLDIHKDSIAVAVAQAGRSTPRFVGTAAPTARALCSALKRCGAPEHTLIVYEAGPCGYGWARYLNTHGWRCEVIAPSHITRQPAEKRIQTDRRDALLLARESRSGNLVKVTVPDERDEAMRDLSRAREDANAARMRARMQLKAMLLRHGHIYRGKSSWTAAHERHLAGIRFEHPAQQIAFNEYRAAVTDAQERVDRLTEALRTQCEQWRMKPVVKALMCMRGFDSIAAITFIAELGDLCRFSHPRALMSYLGLVPSEFSTGNSRYRGSITKSGNKHARRILIESAWTYRFKAQVSREIQVRQQGQPKAVRDIAWKAQLRLCQRYRSLLMGRKLHKNKVCVAIARELAGFVWNLVRQVKIPA